MTIHLDHLIVPSHHKTASAKLLAELLETDEHFPIHHYRFRVGGEEFDAILGRIKTAGISYRSTVRGPVDVQVDAEFGNIYWNEPDGHQWGMLTVNYARPSAAKPRQKTGSDHRGSA